jgi:hypothetical protein
VTTLARLAEPRRLPVAARLALAAEIVSTYLRARRLLRRGDVRAAVTGLRGGDVAATAGAAKAAAAPTAPAPTADYAAGIRLARAVTHVLEPLPLDSRCLMTSLVLSGLLARRGAAPSLVIGVRGGDAFGAHSWVELGGRSLLPTPDGGGFERLVAL